MEKVARFTAVLGFVLSMAVSAALAAQNQYRIRVNGLSCPFCAYGIEKSLGRVPGVVNLNTDIAKGAVIVTMKEGATLDKAAAARAVREAGFSLGGFEEVRKSGSGR